MLSVSTLHYRFRFDLVDLTPLKDKYFVQAIELNVIGERTGRADEPTGHLQTL